MSVSNGQKFQNYKYYLQFKKRNYYCQPPTAFQGKLFINKQF